MAADVAPRTFDEPQGAFETLSRLDHPASPSGWPGCGELDEDERRYWANQLSALRAPTSSAQAWLDTALLMVGGLPTGLPPAREPAAYAQALAEVWTELSGAYPAFSGESCARGLAGYLGGQQWAATAQQALAVTEVARRLAGFDTQLVLVTTVASALAAKPPARQWDFAQEWLAWAVANEPAAITERLATASPVQAPAISPGCAGRPAGRALTLTRRSAHWRNRARSPTRPRPTRCCRTAAGVRRGRRGRGHAELVAVPVQRTARRGRIRHRARAPAARPGIRADPAGPLA